MVQSLKMESPHSCLSKDKDTIFQQVGCCEQDIVLDGLLFVLQFLQQNTQERLEMQSNNFPLKKLLLAVNAERNGMSSFTNKQKGYFRCIGAQPAAEYTGY